MEPKGGKSQCKGPGAEECLGIQAAAGRPVWLEWSNGWGENRLDHSSNRRSNPRRVLGAIIRTSVFTLRVLSRN